MVEPAACCVRRAEPWLGTTVEIAVAGPSQLRLDDAIAAGFAAIAGIHRRLSGHADDSELAHVNRTAFRATQAVSDDFAAVLRCALELASRSGGAFDPTVGAALATLGYLPTRDGARSRGTWRDVALEANRVRYAQPLTLDFDGIAKGYAVDCAVAAIAALGVDQGIVNAGGDLRVWGATPQTVHVRTGGPQSVLMPLVALADAAVATSAYGGQRRSLGGRFATPLIDPRARIPVMSTRTVSVVAPVCMVADALTKVVALRGVRAAGVLAWYGAEATMLSPAAGRWRCTRLPAAASRAAASRAAG
jgi:thiamine biosynthesis lipoprotein